MAQEIREAQSHFNNTLLKASPQSGDTQGQFTLSIPTATTTAGSTSTKVYDLELVANDGTVTRILEGSSSQTASFCLMPAQVIITEPARNIVGSTTTTNSVAITEQVNTVSVAASTVSGAGGGSTSSIINITNTIGDAIAGRDICTRHESLKLSFETLWRHSLRPTIATIGYNATNSQTSGNDLLVECGLSSVVTAISLTFTNPENLDTNTQLSFLDVSDLTSQFSQSHTKSSFGTPTITTLNPTYTIDTLTTPFPRTFRVSCGFLGNDGTGSVQTLQRDFKIFHRHRFYIVTSELPTLTNFGQFLGHGSTDEVVSTLDVDPLAATQSLVVQCNANTANASKFTWIFIASAGTLGEVAAEVNGKCSGLHRQLAVWQATVVLDFLLVRAPLLQYTRRTRSNQPGALTPTLL